MRPGHKNLWRLKVSSLTLLGVVGAGCGQEDRPRNLVDHPHVLGMALNPPEILFDTSDPTVLDNKVNLTLAMLLVDPAGMEEVLDVVVVACTNYGGTCLESLHYASLGPPYVDENNQVTEVGWRDWLTVHSWRGRVDLQQGSSQLEVPLRSFESGGELLYLLGTSSLPAQVALLACPLGACPVFRDYDTYLGDPQARGGEALLGHLVQPDQVAYEAPITSEIFGIKSYMILNYSTLAPNTNPTIGTPYNPDSTDGRLAPPPPGGSIRVAANIPPGSFEVLTWPSGEVGYEQLSVEFFSSTGVMEPQSLKLEVGSGSPTTTWSGAQPGPALVWVVVRDDRTGQGWSEGRVMVE